MSRKAGRNDQRALQDAAARGSGGAWVRLRGLYSERVRAVVDDVHRGGGLSLRDLVNIELAELLSMKEEVAAMSDPGDRLIERMASLELQSRKSLRTLIEAIGDTGAVDTRPVRVPEGLRVLPRADEGDDLL